MRAFLLAFDSPVKIKQVLEMSADAMFKAGEVCMWVPPIRHSIFVQAVGMDATEFEKLGKDSVRCSLVLCTKAIAARHGR